MHGVSACTWAKRWRSHDKRRRCGFAIGASELCKISIRRTAKRSCGAADLSCRMSRRKYMDHTAANFFITASATFNPSIAAEVIPPAYPAPSCRTRIKPGPWRRSPLYFPVTSSCPQERSSSSGPSRTLCPSRTFCLLVLLEIGNPGHQEDKQKPGTFFGGSR